ncbi:MFS transporter [Micromonospora sagamiensis]|uniref:Putative MFS family arabinose efflux permease n=1 Tax=Micromonospora sagamiensis TaxID=47875 RepID=A0A562WPF4_9ACTN|nr:MFS transporter [Micromonospora sagamiensis]TWJ32213.1 putative MFS family arabinose efflux permease [Micromonospora sagamiensis]BCL14729.1 hypothetical protein GCM10017556_24680 [Micromonospora sagamiensis]
MTVSEAVSRRSGRLILTSTSFSALGDGFRYTALPLMLLGIGAGTDTLSTAYVVNSIPGVLFVLFGGLLSDRYPSRRVVVAVDVIRAAASAAFTVALVLDVVSVWMVYALIFALAAAEVVYFSAMQVFIADSLNAADLGVVNGRLASITTTANSLAGPGAGAFLYGVSPALPFLVDAVSFVASGLCNARVPRRREAPRASSTAPSGQGPPAVTSAPPGAMKNLAAGFEVTFADVTLRWLFVWAFVRGVAAAAVLAVLAVFVVTVRGMPVASYGYALAVGAVGGIAGGWLVSRYGDRVDVWTSTWVANIVFGASFMAMPLAHGVPAIGALLAVNLAAAVWTAVVAATYRQRVVERSHLGRVSSVLRLGVGIASIIGAGAAGLIGDAIPLDGLFFGLGLLVVLVCGSAVRRPRRHDLPPGGVPVDSESSPAGERHTSEADPGMKALDR